MGSPRTPTAYQTSRRRIPRIHKRGHEAADDDHLPDRRGRREGKQRQGSEEHREERRVEVGRVLVDVLRRRVERLAGVEPGGRVVVRPGIGQRVDARWPRKIAIPPSAPIGREGEQDQVHGVVGARDRVLLTGRASDPASEAGAPCLAGGIPDRRQERHQHVAQQARRREDRQRDRRDPPPSGGREAQRDDRTDEQQHRPTAPAKARTARCCAPRRPGPRVSVPTKSSVACGSRTSWNSTRPPVHAAKAGQSTASGAARSTRARRAPGRASGWRRSAMAQGVPSVVRKRERRVSLGDRDAPGDRRCEDVRPRSRSPVGGLPATRGWRRSSRRRSPPRSARRSEYGSSARGRNAIARSGG